MKLIKFINFNTVTAYVGISGDGIIITFLGIS